MMHGELPEYFRREIVKARRVHTCYECGKAIDRRTEYVRNTGVWEGRWAEYKVCLACEELREELADWEAEEAPPFGHVLEWKAADDAQWGKE